jgi:hypothetical protein
MLRVSRLDEPFPRSAGAADILPHDQPARAGVMQGEFGAQRVPGNDIA